MKTKTKPNLKKLEPHPLGALFPPMDDISYASLKQSIKEKGFDATEPVILYEDKILDGNHRWTAARSLRMTPPTRKYSGDDPIGYVIQKNIARRHMTPSQAAAVAADLVERIKVADKAAKAEAKAAAKASGKKVKIAKPQNESKRAAKALNISERSVRKAQALKKADPAAHEAVKAGKKSVHGATGEVEQKKSAEQRKSEEFAEATNRIDGICGDGFALIAAKKLTSKDILKLSGLDKDEMIRIKPLVEAGWGLKAALGYKSALLTLAHPIRQLVDRAVASSGRFTFEVDAYDKSWIVDVSQKA